MIFNEKLDNICREKKSLVCVGIDIDLEKVPQFIAQKKDALIFFAGEIIRSTREFACAYKINTAFFEAYGSEGWKAMEKIVAMLPENVIKIADAKRADIGNTSARYAKAFFERLGFDAITVNPYLGYDAIEPFIENPEYGAFVLCHTTNAGAADIQHLKYGDKQLYQIVAEKAISWNKNGNIGLVVGATFPEQMREVRKIAPDLPFLVPGLGAQGGDFDLAVIHAVQENGRGAIFNASRSILYASRGEDFAEKAAAVTKEMRDRINQVLEKERKIER